MNTEKMMIEQKLANAPAIEVLNSSQWEKAKAEADNGAIGWKVIFAFAERWASLMQFEMANGAKLEEIAEKTSFEVDFGDMSGFSFAQAVRVLVDFWVHGERLKNWHNAKYSSQSTGVINPTLI